MDTHSLEGNTVKHSVPEWVVSSHPAKHTYHEWMCVVTSSFLLVTRVHSSNIVLGRMRSPAVLFPPAFGVFPRRRHFTSDVPPVSERVTGGVPPDDAAPTSGSCGGAEADM